ncbi:MAG: gliding motility protein GldN [Chitinophagales bacterium]|nr:gliding motility protein GldN [Chitinophagales bacterium]
MLMRRAVLFLFLVVQSIGLHAQTTETQPRDLFYTQVAVVEREPLPYDYVSENDVYWHKRIWRLIDVNEKMNLPFRYEGLDWSKLKPLVAVLRDAALSGEIQVYDDDQFRTPLTPEQVRQRGAGFDTIPISDLEGNYIKDTVVERLFNPNLVRSYRIKEDWFFNKKSSQMMVRIMGIAPLYFDEGAQISYPIFWVYYPACRPILARAEAFNPRNDSQRWSWEDVLEMRLFSSIIIKESNVFDRRIQDYATGVDALRESDRIKADIFNFEHDLWSY